MSQIYRRTRSPPKDKEIKRKGYQPISEEQCFSPRQARSLKKLIIKQVLTCKDRLIKDTLTL